MFALQMAERYQMQRITLTDDAKQILMRYKWPGNVRQLKNITEQMSVMSTERVIDTDAIRQFIPDDRETTELATIQRKPDNNSYANEREMRWQVIVDMKRTVDTMKAELKTMSQQLDEQRGLAGARGFDTPTEEPLPPITPSRHEQKNGIPTHTPQDFLEAEEIREA